MGEGAADTIDCISDARQMHIRSESHALHRNHHQSVVQRTDPCTLQSCPGVGDHAMAASDDCRMCARCHSRPGVGDMVSDDAMDVAAAITVRDFGGETYDWTAPLGRIQGNISIQVSITGCDFRCWSRDQC